MAHSQCFILDNMHILTVIVFAMSATMLLTAAAAAAVVANVSYHCSTLYHNSTQCQFDVIHSMHLF